MYFEHATAALGCNIVIRRSDGDNYARKGMATNSTQTTTTAGHAFGLRRRQLHPSHLSNALGMATETTAWARERSARVQRLPSTSRPRDSQRLSTRINTQMSNLTHQKQLQSGRWSLISSHHRPHDVVCQSQEAFQGRGQIEKKGRARVGQTKTYCTTVRSAEGFTYSHAQKVPERLVVLGNNQHQALPVRCRRCRLHRRRPRSYQISPFQTHVAAFALISIGVAQADQRTPRGLCAVHSSTCRVSVKCCVFCRYFSQSSSTFWLGLRLPYPRPMNTAGLSLTRSRGRSRLDLK